jgi:hypothetical protein
VIWIPEEPFLNDDDFEGLKSGTSEVQVVHWVVATHRSEEPRDGWGTMEASAKWKLAGIENKVEFLGAVNELAGERGRGKRGTHGVPMLTTAE